MHFFHIYGIYKFKNLINTSILTEKGGIREDAFFIAWLMGNIRKIESFKAIIAVFIGIFCLSILGGYLSKKSPESTSYASVLPKPAELVELTEPHSPLVLRGIKIDPQDPFKLNFLIDEGDTHLNEEAIKQETQKHINYFLASLTIPEEDLWVNLSPYEQDRIIPQELSLTDMGKDMLSQDYTLKQLLSSLTYPESKLGQQFWSKVYKQVQAKLGTTNIPIDTFNKVWIVPEKAIVYEDGELAFIGETKLKVLLEEDYLALTNSNRKYKNPEETNQISSQVMREVILPIIEQEVNHGEHFSQLRKIYHALILASWYKDRLSEGFISKAYANQRKIKGIDLVQPQAKEEIYGQYVQAYKKGVYNYIRKDYDSHNRQYISRRYYSGGMGLVVSRVREDRPAEDREPNASSSASVTLAAISARDKTAIEAAKGVAARAGAELTMMQEPNGGGFRTSSSSTKGNKEFNKKWVAKAVQMTREIIAEDEETRKVGRHACQGSAILLNDILNNMGIPSEIVGLDFKWLEPRWSGLHYAVKTIDDMYADAQPESISPNFEDFGGPFRPPYKVDTSKKGFVLSPGSEKYEQYKTSEERAGRRDWGFASPKVLKKQNPMSAELEKVYTDRIDQFKQEYQAASAKLAAKSDSATSSSSSKPRDEFAYRQADIITGESQAAQLLKRFAQYEGEVYYPCALGDKFSLFALMNMFPKASRFVFNDNFDQNHTILKIPNAGNLPGIINFLRESFSFMDRYYDLEVTPLDIRTLEITITIKDETIKRSLNRDSVKILYKISDYNYEKDSYGVIYVQEPGLAGTFSTRRDFWEKMASQLEKGGVVLASESNTQQPPVSILTNKATVMGNQGLGRWVPLGTPWKIYEKRQGSSSLAAGSSSVAQKDVIEADSLNPDHLGGIDLNADYLTVDSRKQKFSHSFYSSLYRIDDIEGFTFTISSVRAYSPSE